MYFELEFNLQFFKKPEIKIFNLNFLRLMLIEIRKTLKISI